MDRRQQRTYTVDEMIQILARLLHREAAKKKAGERTISYRMDQDGMITRCDHAQQPERVV